MSLCTYCGRDHKPDEWVTFLGEHVCPQRSRRTVAKVLLANLAIILVCAAWLMLAGCGGGLRIEFPPKTEVHPVETIGEVAAVAASMAKAPASSDTSSDPWKSQAIWAGSVLALAYPFGRLIRTRLLNPTKPE